MTAPHSLALIIAVEEYAHARFAPPQAAEGHARQLAERLASPPHEFEVHTVFGEEATKANVEIALDDMALEGVSHRLLVVFTGAGSSLFQGGEEVGMLACYDSIVDDPMSFLTISEATAVRLYSGVRHVAFILDAPISGQALGLVRPDPVLEGVDPSAVMATQVMSGGVTPGGTGGYISVLPHLCDLLGPEHYTSWSFTDLAKRMQRWLNRQTMPPQILQAGHLLDSLGGEFSFGPPPLTELYTPTDEAPPPLQAPPTHDELRARAQAAKLESSEFRRQEIEEARRRMQEQFRQLDEQRRSIDELYEQLLRRKRQEESDDEPPTPEQ